jgi:hypothetical protein
LRRLGLRGHARVLARMLVTMMRADATSSLRLEPTTTHARRS